MTNSFYVSFFLYLCCVKEKPSIETFPGEYQGTIQSDGYSVYKQSANENPLIEHLLCRAHVRAKFKLAADISKEEEAAWFVEQIGRLYLIEAEGLMRRLTPGEIKKRRNKSDVSEILKGLRKQALELQQDKRCHYGKMMETALAYMLNGWDDLLKYRHRDDYTIDNMVAERAIRPFTVSRKNSLHFSSEEGVDVAMTFYTIIEIAKMYLSDIKGYLIHVFRELLSGNKNYETLIPSAVSV